MAVLFLRIRPRVENSDSRLACSRIFRYSASREQILHTTQPKTNLTADDADTRG